jgi:hypothetical protein
MFGGRAAAAFLLRRFLGFPPQPFSSRFIGIVHLHSLNGWRLG